MPRAWAAGPKKGGRPRPRAARRSGRGFWRAMREVKERPSHRHGHHAHLCDGRRRLFQPDNTNVVQLGAHNHCGAGCDREHVVPWNQRCPAPLCELHGRRQQRRGCRWQLRHEVEKQPLHRNILPRSHRDEGHSSRRGGTKAAARGSLGARAQERHLMQRDENQAGKRKQDHLRHRLQRAQQQREPARRCAAAAQHRVPYGEDGHVSRHKYYRNVLQRRLPTDRTAVPGSVQRRSAALRRVARAEEVASRRSRELWSAQRVAAPRAIHNGETTRLDYGCHGPHRRR